MRSVEPPIGSTGFLSLLVPQVLGKGQTWVPSFFFFFLTERRNLTKSPTEFYHTHYLQTGFARRFGLRVQGLTLDSVFPAFTAI